MGRSSGVPRIFSTSFWKCFGFTAPGGGAEAKPSDGTNASNSSTFSGSGASWMR